MSCGFTGQSCASAVPSNSVLTCSQDQNRSPSPSHFSDGCSVMLTNVWNSITESSPILMWQPEVCPDLGPGLRPTFISNVLRTRFTSQVKQWDANAKNPKIKSRKIFWLESCNWWVVSRVKSSRSPLQCEKVVDGTAVSDRPKLGPASGCAKTKARNESREPTPNAAIINKRK